MLANNICDLDEDEKNHRYTLVHYMGKKNSLYLFVGLNLLAFGTIVVNVILELVPLSMLLTLVSLPFVFQQTREFFKKPVKSQTFICAVRILAVGAFIQVVCFAIGIWLT